MHRAHQYLRTMTSSVKCTKCLDNLPTKKFLYCSKCEGNFHLHCVSVTFPAFKEIIANDSAYFCPPCLKNQTEEVGEDEQIEATQTGESALDEDEYEVLEILDHKDSSDGRLYHVLWKVDASKSWVHQDQCRCIGLINQYLKSKNLPTMTDKYGADDDEITANWMTVPKVFEYIAKYDRVRVKKHITITESEGHLPTEDAILIMPYWNHLFVGLYLSEIYISDGGNLSREIDVEKLLKEELGTTINFDIIDFKDQRAGDHCGSSAACIAIELKRIYQDLEFMPKTISSSKWMQNQIIRANHKMRSTKTYPNLDIRNQIVEKRCPNCNKLYRERSKIRFRAHVRRCLIAQDS